MTLEVIARRANRGPDANPLAGQDYY